MKYCTKCGNPVEDETVVCPKCGCLVEAGRSKSLQTSQAGNYAQIITILSIINCVLTAVMLIPLAWNIPMTVYYHNSLKEGRDVGVAFKVCKILFSGEICGVIAGVLMLANKVEE